MIVCPVVGEYLRLKIGDSFIILVSILIAIADLAFIKYIVPESMRFNNNKKISWMKILNPFNVNLNFKQIININLDISIFIL